MFTFNGTLFGSNGDQLAAETGTYTAIITFRSWLDRDSPESSVVEKPIAFRWSLEK